MVCAPVKATIQELLYSLRELENFYKTHVLENLKKVLRYLIAMVDDAEEKQNESLVVKLWLDELLDAVHRTEDLLDEICTEALRSKLDAESQNKSKELVIKDKDAVDKIFTKALQSKLDAESRTQSSPEWKEGIGTKMEEILDRLKFLLGLKGEIGDDIVRLIGPIRSDLVMGFGPGKGHSSVSTTSESEVFGRNGDKETIISLLLSDDVRGEQLSVFPMVGEVGIGKTTLAGLVYNDNRVSQHFDLKTWYRVDHFDWFTVTKAISESSDLKGVVKGLSLQNSLGKKRFLLVLDDVGTFKYAEWELLRSTLTSAANGSCVIVTTRDLEVASKMGTCCAYCVKPLSNEESWLVFSKFAFGDQKPSSYPELETIGRQIVQEFHGLPMAIRIFGLLLRSKPQAEEWRLILNRVKHFYLPSSDGLEIRKWYDNFPAHLERCFAYCSIFPKGYEFEKEKLVLLWMAEGLLQDCGNEDDGNECFDELLSKSFFQRSKGDSSRFVMVDLMNDLAAHLSWRHFFRLEDNNSSHISVSTLYLSLLEANVIPQ